MLATSPHRTTYAGAPGILEIGDEGFARHPAARASLAPVRRGTSSTCTARHGCAVEASILADFGTTFMLQRHYFGPGVGKLIVLNDGDFAVGATAGSKGPADVRQPGPGSPSEVRG